MVTKKINKPLTTMRSLSNRIRVARSLKVPRISSRLFGTAGHASVYHDTWESQAKEEVYRRRAGCRYMCTTVCSEPPMTWVVNVRGATRLDFGEVKVGLDVGRCIFASGIEWRHSALTMGDATILKRLWHKRMPHMY